MENNNMTIKKQLIIIVLLLIMGLSVIILYQSFQSGTLAMSPIDQTTSQENLLAYINQASSPDNYEIIVKTYALTSTLMVLGAISLMVGIMTFIIRIGYLIKAVINNRKKQQIP